MKPRKQELESIAYNLLLGVTLKGEEVISLKTAEVGGERELSYKLKVGPDIHSVLIKKTRILLIPVYTVTVKSSSGNKFEECFVNMWLGGNFNRAYYKTVNHIDSSSRLLRPYRLQKLKMALS